MIVKLFNSWDDLKGFLHEGQIKPVRINKQRFLLMRSNNEAFLTEPYCPHQDCPLSDAKITPQGEVVCMWHSYRYRLFDGKETLERTRNLLVQKIKENELKEMVVEV